MTLGRMNLHINTTNLPNFEKKIKNKKLHFSVPGSSKTISLTQG